MAWEQLDDDSSILDDDELWRRIHPKWVVPDENRGGSRVSSAAFDDSRDGSPTSVLLATVVQETGRTAADVIAPFEQYSLASLTVGQARACHQGVARDPQPDEPAHAFMFGPKSKAVKRRLAREAAWAVSPC